MNSDKGNGANVVSTPRRKRRSWIRRMLLILLCPLIIVAAINVWVLAATRGKVYRADGKTPSEAVALVLGTSKRQENGQPNLHFTRRLDAAAALYKRGQVRHVLVSGANPGPFYNEPRDMKDGLVARGVPAAAITCDTRGWRTLDSVMRARERFGLRRCAIVSDGWHVPRALFIARKCGLDAIGISAAPVPVKYSLKARTREWGARVLVVLDLYVLDTRPRDSKSAGEVDLGTIGREPRRPPASAQR
jgi:SanA protein